MPKKKTIKKAVKKEKRKTPKQAKLIKLISANVSATGMTKSMHKMMLEAGYSESMARKQLGVTDSPTIREATEPIVQAMLDERDAAIERMKSIRAKAKYRDLTDAIDKLTKNIQLLTGKETEKHEHTVVYIPGR